MTITAKVLRSFTCGTDSLLSLAKGHAGKFLHVRFRSKRLCQERQF